MGPGEAMYLMQKANTQKSRDTVPLMLIVKCTAKRASEATKKAYPILSTGAVLTHFP